MQLTHLLFGHPLELFPIGFQWWTLVVSLLSFIRNKCPSHFDRVCLILLNIGCCDLWLIVQFAILCTYAIHIILLNQWFSQASSRLSMCFVTVLDSLPYVNIGTTQLLNCLSFKPCRLKIDLPSLFITEPSRRHVTHSHLVRYQEQQTSAQLSSHCC